MAHFNLDKREVVEGTLYQGEDEQIAYTLDVTAIGNTPTSSSVKVYSKSGGSYTDVTATVMPTGSSSELGNIITTPILKSLTAGVTYRMEIKYTLDGNVLENYVWIIGTK